MVKKSMNGRQGPPRGTVAEGNFDHPVNGQKVNEPPGKADAGAATNQKPSPRVRGTARNERWMREVSDYLMLPYSVTLMLQRAHLLGYVSQERFLGLGIS